MRAVGLLLLLSLSLSYGTRRYHPKNANGYLETMDAYIRIRRENNVLHDWLTANQKAVLIPLKDKPAQFKQKVMEFYGQLSEEKQNEWNKFYKDECVAWIKEVASDDEISELKDLLSRKDEKTLDTKLEEYKGRLTTVKREEVDRWEDDCHQLWKENMSRKRRGIDKHFEQFTKWMTSSQNNEIEHLRNTNKSFDEIHVKILEYFDDLSIKKKNILREEIKDNCKKYLSNLSTHEEMEKLNSLYESHNYGEIHSIIKNVIDRQTGDDKIIAVEMQKLCTNIYNISTKKRRDIDAKINRHLKWLNAEQKNEIRDMYSAGRPQEEIKAKLLSFLSKLDKPSEAIAKDQMQKECYQWLGEVASKEEIDALHKMHETDHDGCKKKVREYLARLSDDRKVEIEKNLPFCEKIWYGNHNSPSTHSEHSHLAKRYRRHLNAIEKYISWLTPDQKKQVEDIENSGVNFDDVINKVREFYEKQNDQKKRELKQKFKVNVNLEHSKRSLERKLISTRKVLISRLDICTSWRDDIDDDKSKYLDSLLVQGEFEKFREFGAQVARKIYPESEDCLRSLRYLIKKYRRILNLKRRHIGNTEMNHIEDFLSPQQLRELHMIYQTGADKSVMENVLNRYLDGFNQERKSLLIQEFFKYKPDLRRRPREIKVREIIKEKSSNFEEPQEFDAKWLQWMTPRHKNIVNRMKIGRATKWEIMNQIGDQFYQLRKEIRQKFKEPFQNYCITNLKKIIGEDNYSVLLGMYLDTDPVDQIETKFHEIVGNLQNESDRLLADHYGTFCRKIFRLVHFEPTDLTTWLTARQKFALGEMIQNPKINDMQIYDKMYEFFSSATGEQKEEASDVIETGCRHFIAHMFGDDNAEELEEMRQSNSISTQHLAARLASHAREVRNEKDRERAENSLPICSRIYLAYDGSCYCNEHSKTCDKISHSCLNCTDNTYGVQCELCLESYTGNPKTGQCFPIETETSSCACNNHTTICDSEGKCQNCLHNTVGDNCERCVSGYYGDSLKGGEDDCIRCPCPNNGECFINDQGLVQCFECPLGMRGITCEESEVIEGVNMLENTGKNMARNEEEIV